MAPLANVAWVAADPIRDNEKKDKEEHVKKKKEHDRKREEEEAEERRRQRREPRHIGDPYSGDWHLPPQGQSYRDKRKDWHTSPKRHGPPMESFFLSKDGINREVLQYKIGFFLGSDAFSRPCEMNVWTNHVKSEMKD